jgi:hypothetical protein
LMPISGNQWRLTAGAFHSAIVASPIWQDHSDYARTAHGTHAEQPDSCPVASGGFGVRSGRTAGMRLPRRELRGGIRADEHVARVPVQTGRHAFALLPPAPAPFAKRSRTGNPIPRVCIGGGSDV